MTTARRRKGAGRGGVPVRQGGTPPPAGCPWRGAAPGRRAPGPLTAGPVGQIIARLPFHSPFSFSYGGSVNPMNTTSKLGFTLVAAAVVALYGCGKEEPKKAEAPKAPAAPVEEVVVVKIGHAGPLTGGIAHLGKDNENGARLAVDEANAKQASRSAARRSSSN